jgi:short-subunit dehydrogenase
VTYIIAGASSGLGRALAERFAAAGCELLLLSRDLRDTSPLASHIAIKYAVKVSPVAMDLNSNPLPFDEIDTILEGHLPLKGLLMPAGINDDCDVVGLSDNTFEYLTRINYAAPCQLLNHYLPLLEQNSGVIVCSGQECAGILL